MEALKTCPFCGSNASCMGDDGWIWVECESCDAKMGFRGLSVYGDPYGAFETLEDAITAWNSREPRETTMVQIFQRVAVDNGITVQDLRSATRLRHVAWPRQYGMLLCRRNGLTYEQIGRYLHRDYTTVMHGVQAALKRESEK